MGAPIAQPLLTSVIDCDLFKAQHKELDKAQHYIDLLETTRCAGRWEEVPELARKVEKHAPTRKCTSASRSKMALFPVALGSRLKER